MPAKNHPETERREYIRLDSVFPVQFQILGLESNSVFSDWLQGFTSNISKSGICLTVNILKPQIAKILKEEQVKLSLEINLPLLATPALATARIVWIKEINNQPDKYQIGLNYLQIDPGANKRIMRYTMAKKMFAPAAITIIIILFLSFSIGSILHTRMVIENKLMKRNLQAKIELLQIDIKTTEEKKAQLQKEIAEKEKIHQETETKLIEKLKLKETETAKQMSDYDLTIKTLTAQKEKLVTQLSSLQHDESINQTPAPEQENKVDSDIADLTKAIALEPNNVNNYINLAQAFVKKGDFDQAIKDLTKALAIDPKNENIYLQRGMAFWVKTDFNRAIADFTHAIEINPNNANSYTGRGFAYISTKNFDQAIADYTKAILISTTNNTDKPALAYAYGNRALAYAKKGNFDKAFQDFNKTIENDPGNPNYYNNRGLAYDTNGNFEQAINDFSKAIEIEPKITYIYANRAKAYFHKKEFDKAWADIHKAQALGVTIDPLLTEELKKASGKEN